MLVQPPVGILAADGTLNNLYVHLLELFGPKVILAQFCLLIHSKQILANINFIIQKETWCCLVNSSMN